MQVTVLRERVDEEADGEPDSAEHSPVQTGFGGDAPTPRGEDGFIFADLDEVCSEADGCPNAEGDIGEARDAFAPAALFAEGNGDDG